MFADRDENVFGVLGNLILNLRIIAVPQDVETTKVERGLLADGVLQGYEFAKQRAAGVRQGGSL